MNIKEIYVLNTALDGKQIVYLPDFSKLHMSVILINSVKEHLVYKGLLESVGAFTMEGVKIVKRMEDFKQAKKYIKLGALVIGLINENEGVLLKYIPGKEDYSFERIDMTNRVSNLTAAYPFLTELRPSQNPANPESLTLEEIQERFHPGIDNSIYLSTMDLNEDTAVNGGGITNEIIFDFEGSIYLYDQDAGLLFSKGRDEILTLIKERMTA